MISFKQVASSAMLAFAALGVQAQDIGQHPAVFTPRQLPSIDPSTFIVAHPAGLLLRPGHANHEHPAVVNKAAVPSLDVGRYLVQPPSTTRWSGPRPAAPAFAQAPVVLR